MDTTEKIEKNDKGRIVLYVNNSKMKKINTTQQKKRQITLLCCEQKKNYSDQKNKHIKLFKSY